MTMVSSSEIRAWKTCRQQWDWSFRENLEPTQGATYFTLGRAVHFIDELVAQGNSVEFALDAFRAEELKTIDQDQMFYEQIVDGLDEILETARELRTAYDKWQAKEAQIIGDYFSDVNFENVAFELTIEWPELKRKGRLDRIVRSTVDGKWYVWETKTTQGNVASRAAVIPSEEQPWFYLALAEHYFGVEFSGVIYTIISKDQPHPPKLLKNKTLSTAKNQVTTFDLYWEAIKENHPDAEATWIAQEYGEILQLLGSQPERFFLRTLFNPSRAAQNYKFKSQGRAIIEMSLAPLVYEEEGWHCNRCPFKNPCKQLRDGEEPDFSAFRTKVKNHVEIEVSDGGE